MSHKIPSKAPVQPRALQINGFSCGLSGCDPVAAELGRDAPREGVPPGSHQPVSRKCFEKQQKEVEVGRAEARRAVISEHEVPPGLGLKLSGGEGSNFSHSVS